MSREAKTFHNLRCDRCGELLDPENWYEEEYFLEDVMRECCWKQIGDRHYCPDCWEYDDDDNVIVKDFIRSGW